MRIVLIGDVHVYVLAVWPWELLSKRLVGQMNLWFNRRRVFDLKRLPSLARRVLELEPDAVLCSGDLTTTAHRREFKRVEKTLGFVFDRVPTFIVPGNHDRYTAGSMRGRHLEAGFADHTADDWPHHRSLGEGVELIGLDPTRPTPWFNASGWCGPEQLDRLEALLRGIPVHHRVIVLCHYPIASPPGHKVQSFGHKLHDAERLWGILSATPHRVLYLHGHVHSPWCWRMAEPAGHVVAINAGAPIMADADHPVGQGFWQIDLPAGCGGGAEGEGAIEAVHHVPEPAGSWRAERVVVPAEAGKLAGLSGVTVG